jgi:hypothetical protein
MDHVVFLVAGDVLRSKIYDETIIKGEPIFKID